MMRNIKTREGFKYWDNICALKHYGFVHSPDNSRVLKAEGIGNWIDMHEAQSIVDAAEEDLNEARSKLAALREENRILNHDIASYLETTAKVCELLGIDTDDAKHAEGKPSDVLFSHATALQQRLADAERRNAEYLELIQECIERISRVHHFGLKRRLEVALDAALTKPEEAKS